MKPTSHDFKANAARALADPVLKVALARLRTNYIGAITRARAALPEFEALRDEAIAIKSHVLDHLDLYLEEFERKAAEQGGRVHWASSAAEARAVILDICRAAGARKVLKGKSMISEEIALNAHLEEGGLQVVETDLGEYLIQIRKEAPSHIIGPAVHVTREQVEADFRRIHTHLPAERKLDEPAVLVAEARQVLREHFLTADVGITGANFLIAETGSAVIVTNEGNGDLSETLPRVHITLASIEKIVPTLEDATTLIRVLARSATGQEISTYTTFATGTRREGDPDGPGEHHIVLYDGGRSEILGSAFREVLRCIRCGACMDHCPVYHAVGGHAYGWVYPGPIGAALDPALIGAEEAYHLPQASSFCGRCEEVCPMRIPLPQMMRHWREKSWEMGREPALSRQALRAWAFIARRPWLYRLASRVGVGVLRIWASGRGSIRRLPLAAGWCEHRDLPAPEGGTFMSAWARAEREKRRGAKA